MNKGTATLIGLSAIVLWSMLTGLIKGVADTAGPVGGSALIYTGSAIATLFLTGCPKRIPLKHLLIAGPLFVSYEICLTLSIGLSHTPTQAIEIAMLNYLWPGLTILFAVLFNREKATWFLVPGVLLSFLGVYWVSGGNISLASLAANIQSNSLCYGLGLLAAFLWSAYCTVCVRTSGGYSSVTPFLFLVAAALWGMYALTDTPPLSLAKESVLWVLLASCATGGGYAAWNIGIIRGNITILAAFSYFIPVFSSAFASAMLDATLSEGFWQGTAMVCAGSLLSWLATLGGRKR